MRTEQLNRLKDWETLWQELIAADHTAQGHLKSGDSFCIMGAACELYRRHHEEHARWDGNGFKEMPHVFAHRSKTPDRVLAWFGLNDTTENDLMNANDGEGPYDALAALRNIIRQAKENE